MKRNNYFNRFEIGFKYSFCITMRLVVTYFSYITKYFFLHVAEFLLRNKDCSTKLIDYLTETVKLCRVKMKTIYF